MGWFHGVPDTPRTRAEITARFVQIKLQAQSEGRSLEEHETAVRTLSGEPSYQYALAHAIRTDDRNFWQELLGDK